MLFTSVSTVLFGVRYILLVLHDHSIVTVFPSSKLELPMQTDSSRKSVLASWSPNANWYGLIWFGWPEVVNFSAQMMVFVSLGTIFWSVKKILSDFYPSNNLPVLYDNTNWLELKHDCKDDINMNAPEYSDWFSSARVPLQNLDFRLQYNLLL